MAKPRSWRKAPDRQGRFVVIVGPDGVGKTTLAAELLRAWPAEQRYFHFRPPLIGTMPAAPPPDARVASPRLSHDGSRVLGWFRVLRNFILFYAAHLLSIRPAVGRGALVVGDRWAYGYVAAPHQLKYYGPDWLARWVIRKLPQPHLVVCLTASAEVVAARKPELAIDQIRREDQLWKAVPAPKKLVLSALDTPQMLADKVLSSL